MLIRESLRIEISGYIGYSAADFISNVNQQQGTRNGTKKVRLNIGNCFENYTKMALRQWHLLSIIYMIENLKNRPLSFFL